jgi:Carbohydrate binding module (family 6)/Secretion system C-terminal sorting domain/PKD domain
MKQVVLLFCLFAFLSSRSQSTVSETHDFITYDTTVAYHGLAGVNWYLRISRPANLFKAGSPDTASRPALISMPGIGEIGSNPANLTAYGPHYWLNNGWDGSVQLGNGIHYPIIITIAQGMGNSSPYYLSILMDSLKRWYHIKPKGVHVAGLSEGAFEWGDLICYAGFNGDEHAMSGVTSYVALSGEGSTYDGNNFGFNLPGFTAYTVWAQKYGGKLWSMQGTNDDRYDYDVRNAMVAGSPGSAYFSWTSDGGGTHCCWNDEYNPSTNNWQCVAPITNHNIAVSSQPNSMGTYKQGSNLFQWMLRQGDTSLAGATAAAAPAVSHPTPVVSAGTDPTITLPTNSVTLTGSASETGGTITSYLWTKVSGGAATISTPAAANTTITGLVAGTYVFKLLATDKNGDTASSTVQVVVNSAPAPPAPPVTTPKPAVAAPAPAATPAPTGKGTYITNVIVAEYRTWYVTNSGGIFGYNNNNASPFPVQFPIGGSAYNGGVGGFNYFRVLDNSGYVWSSEINYTTNSTRILTDTTGAAFSGNWYIDGYGDAALTIRADSSVWYFGTDVYSLFYPGGNLVTGTGVAMAPTRLSPAGMKFKKVLFGGNGIIGLTTTGQVYKWFAGGSRTPTLMTTPRPAIDVFISHLDLDGCIIPDPGETSGMGYPYVWGGTTSMYGGTTAYTEPTSIKSLWNMTVPIKQISVDWNTIHYIDSLGNMYGTGFNSFGEVGNGQEFINKYNYPGFPGYGWDLVDYENPTGLPVQIGKGVKWKQIFSNNWFSFYKYAQDVNDSIYSWGRNKSLDLGNGKWGGYNTDEYHPNSLDVLQPTMVHPLTTPLQQYGWVAPTISAGPKQNITGTTATLKGTAQPLLLIADNPVPAINGIDTAGYHVVAWQWTKVSGNGGTIVTPTASTTSVTGLSTGTYIFQLVTTDNNTGTLMARDTVIVTGTAADSPVVSAGNPQTISLPNQNSVTLTGSASETGGSIVSYAWTLASGQNQYSINSPNEAVTVVSNLARGTYVFRLTVTDNKGVKASATVNVTVNPPPTIYNSASTVGAIPGTIKGISYNAASGPDDEVTTDVGGGVAVFWVSFGAWMTYNVNVATAGEYTVNFRVANGSAWPTSFELQNAGLPVATVTVNPTGGYQDWATVSATVTLPAGAQTLKVISTSSELFNLNWMQFSLSGAAAATTGMTIPGTIKAADFNTGVGLDAQETQATSDAGGGLNVGWITDGDFMFYSVNVLTAGTYTVGFRVATPYTGATFQLLNSAGQVLTSVKSPNTGGWQDWATTTATVTLPAGQQLLKLVSTSPYVWNFNWMQFTLASTALGGAGTAGLETTDPAAFGDSTGIGGNPAGLSVYPNPVRDNVNLYLNDGHTGQFIVQVMNPSGGILRTYSFTKDQSLWQGVVSLGNLPTGVYFLRISGESWQEVKKLIKL